MILSKDIYEYLLNFVDDRDVINMLSVNKKFRNEELFQREIKRRYPLLVRFKKDRTWQDFYISTIFYLEKLRHMNMPYRPLIDFNPENIYAIWTLDREETEIIIDSIYKDQDDCRDYHTIAYKNKNDRYDIQNKLYSGSSLSFRGLADNNYNEIMIDLTATYQPLNLKKGDLWLTFEAENDIDSNSKLYNSKEEAVKSLFNEYKITIQTFIDVILQNEFASDRQDALKFSNLGSEWDNFENFKLFVEKANYPIVILYSGIPTMDSIRYDFALVQVYI